MNRVDLLGCIAQHERVWKFSFDGEVFEVRRAYLGDHLMLGMVLDKFRTALSNGLVEPALEWVKYYINRVTHIDTKRLNNLTFIDLALFVELVEINSLRIDLDFLSAGSHQPSTPEVYAYDYPDRVKLLWYHKLASAYGWTHGDISRLIPEEAVCLLQEIAIDQHNSQEWEYDLSQVGFKQSGDGKTMVKQPFPKPEWMQHHKSLNSKLLKESQRIPQSMLPVGLVIGVDGEQIINKISQTSHSDGAKESGDQTDERDQLP